MQLIQIDTRVACRDSHLKLGFQLDSSYTTKQANRYLGFKTGYALSRPSKMPCHSYSIPASTCKIGSKLASIPGSTCYDCYALKGMYTLKRVRVAMRRRFKALRKPRWVWAMVPLIERQAKLPSVNTPHFRWQDSGDIQSLKHLCKIVRIAVLMPHITFWIPTRENAIVAKYRKYRTIPSNLIIRESTTMVDGPIPVSAEGRTYSTVHTKAPQTGAVACIAPRQKGECRKCRKCWSPKVHCISYHKH